MMEIESGSGDWIEVGSVAESEPCGSVSSHDPDGRQVLLFGFMDGAAGVWRSLAGVDVESVAVRVVHSTGFEQLSDLAEPYEREVALGIFTEKGPTCKRVRWRLSDDLG